MENSSNKPTPTDEDPFVLIRAALEGKDFSKLTQEDLDEISLKVNSMPRNDLNGKAPIDFLDELEEPEN